MFFQCFSTSEYKTSVVKMKLQLLCFFILTFSFSSLLSFTYVLYVCLCTPCIDFRGNFRKSFPIFLLLFGKIGLPIKYSFWLKLSFFYFKIFLLRLVVVNLCIYVITKRPLWLLLAHFLQEDTSQSNFAPLYGVCFLVCMT